ncbi:unnamed protein product [Rotaria sordida]|uniref:Arginase n=1 Tax=Rotaria sordida TaxID=392033 RepID=A0A815T9I7_9BILA|nr:unnamed protein product [Rotaria sordida]CAF4174367.1 unnamed protein product [Rotaria sordida]
MSTAPNHSFGIVKYNCHLGQEKSGVEKSPDILSDALQSYLDQNHVLSHIYDSNEIRKQDLKLSEDEYAIFQANLSLRHRVMQSLKTNTKTLNIGGDHTMGLGTVSAFLECFVNKEKVIIWLDAHADVNTRKTSKSGHYHGMPVAFLLGLDKDEKFPINVRLKPEELIYVGLRDVDLFEKNQVISKYNIRCISISQLINRNIDELVTTFIGENKYVHISWDVDSTNPETEISSTGTPVKGGLTCEQIKAFIHAIAKHNQLVSFDVTELNLALGSAEDRKASLDNTVNVLKSYIDC